MNLICWVLGCYGDNNKPTRAIASWHYDIQVKQRSAQIEHGAFAAEKLRSFDRETKLEAAMKRHESVWQYSQGLISRCTELWKDLVNCWRRVSDLRSKVGGGGIILSYELPLKTKMAAWNESGTLDNSRRVSHCTQSLADLRRMNSLYFINGNFFISRRQRVLGLLINKSLVTLLTRHFLLLSLILFLE